MGISKNDIHRWVLVRSTSNPGSDSFRCFGGLGPVGTSGISGKQPIFMGYMTEDELETEVNSIAGDSNYYKDAVETSNPLFIGNSGKYTPINNE